MKKIISLIILTSMVLSAIGCYVYAENIILLDEDLQSKYDILYNLGFVTFDFNEQNAGDEVSRAEVVDTVVNMVTFYNEGKSTQANHKGYTYFTDVDSSTEYADSILYASEQGIVYGTDGMFMPQRAVTLSETIAFIMRAAGYKIYAEVNEGYQVGYIKAAREAGLVNAALVNGDDIISRARLVELLYDAMNMNVMEQRFFGEENTYVKSDETVSEYFHDIYTTSGKVKATFVSALIDEKPTDKNSIQVEDELYNVQAGEYAGYLGYYVDVYYKKTDYGSKNILYMVKSDQCDELVINADEINNFSGLVYSYGEKNRQEKISKEHTLIINGKRQTEYENDDFLPQNGYVVLVGKDGEYDTVIVNTFKNVFLQRMIIGGADQLTLTEKETLRRFEIDLYDENLCVEVYKDNEKVEMNPFSYEIKGVEYNTTTFVDIPEGSVASVFADEYVDMNGWIVPSKNAKFIKIYVTTPSVYGTCTAVYDEEIKIDDIKYEKAHINFLDTLRPGDVGFFVKDFDGKIFAKYDNRYIKELSYAYLIQGALNGVFDKELTLKIMEDDGKIAEYSLADNVRLNGRTEKDHEALYNKLVDSAKIIDNTFAISQPIKVSIDINGNINQIQTVSLEENEETITKNGQKRELYSRNDNGYMLYSGGTAEFLQPKTIFSVPKTETYEEKHYKVLKSWIPNYSKKLVDVFDVSLHRIPGLVVAYEDEKKSSLYRDIVMVGEILQSADDEGHVVTEIKAYDGYGEVYYYSEDDDIFAGLKEGDVIRLYGHGEEINSWEYIIPIDDVLEHNYSSSQGIKNEGLYEIYSVKDSELTLQHDSLVENTDSGQRISQMGVRWNNDPASFSNGVVEYDGGKRKDKVLSYGVNTGVPESVKTVRNVGNAESTKAYIIVSSGAMINFIALYNGI